jgi:sporulation protein YlmC with PRC-barrel domain
MTRSSLALALALSTALAAPAFAQTAAQPAGDMVKQPDATTPATQATAPATAAGSFITQAQAGQYRASKLVGVNIYNNADENIGEVNELIVDGTGKVLAVVVGVGGFLGIGEKNVALPFETVKWTDAPRQTAANTNPPAGTATTPAPMAPAGTGATTDTTGAVAAAPAPKDYPDHGIIDMTKDQLQNAPQFKYVSEK